MVLQCYNRLESLLGLTECVTQGCYKGVTRCYKIPTRENILR